MSDSFQNFIDGINTHTLWDHLNIKFPGMGHIKIPDKLKDIKVFPMDTLMAELPINDELQPMESLPWVGSLWFYVFLILAIMIVFGICIMKRKTIKKLGYKCRGCWSGCRKRVVTGMRKVLAETICLVLILINEIPKRLLK